MEYRKLIGFGKNSFVVSLPKTWVEKNKLKKGDLIYVDQKTDNLTLSGKPIEKQDKGDFFINVVGKEIPEIKRKLEQAYINNYRSIVLSGPEVGNKIKDLRALLNEMMALEIMEQSSNKVVAKDFLDIKTISIPNLVRKIDNIVRYMISDSKATLDTDHTYGLDHRDFDVNKLSFLVTRAINFGLENPSHHNIKAREYFNYWWLVVNLEEIGDEAKRSARFINRLKVTKAQKEEIRSIYSEIEKTYLQAMKAFYNRDFEAAIKLSAKKRYLMDLCNGFLDKNYKTKNIAEVFERLKKMSLNVHSITKIIWGMDEPQINNSQKS